MIRIFLSLLLPCLLPLLAFTTVSDNNHSADAALRMWKAATTKLAPVYEPLAEWITERFSLEEKQGIGLDIGSGPGTLIIALCHRTPMHWVNVDINPYCFPIFFEEAEKADCEGRVSAMAADVADLPFKSNFADIIVSRGSYPFWDNKEKGFAEIYRVLKPGCSAFIGRGFSENLPVKVARQVREKQNANRKNSILNYKVEKSAEELKAIMKSLEIKDYEIIIPKPEGSDDVNYGMWIIIHKPESKNP